MKTSKNIRIRRMLSNNSSRQIISCLSPKEILTGLRLEQEDANKITSDPFRKLQSGTKPHLKPVSLKTSRKCSIITSKSSTSLKIPETSRLINPLPNPNKSSLYSNFTEFDKSKQSRSLKLPDILNFKLEIPYFGGKETKILKDREKRQKRVTFAPKCLEVSFGSSEKTSEFNES